MLFATILVTIGIDATDNLGNMKQSIVGKAIFGEEGLCPEGMAYVPFESGDFCIDKYEASPNSKCPEIFPQNQQDTRVNLTSAGCAPDSVAGARPWTFISQTQAREACARAGKRLASNAEWFAASLGTPDPQKNNWGKTDCQLSSNWLEQPGETGSGENCLSSYGSYDMVGNVWEWVIGQTENGEYSGKKLPESGYIDEVDLEGLASRTNKTKGNPNFNNDYMWLKNSDTRGMARGGFWDNEKEGGLYATYLVSRPSFAGAGIGFRCVK